MSEHAWVLEHLASYSADGLDPAECERLEQHVVACAPCARALEETRSLDQCLEGLFAPVRPEPALEDRMIRALRTGRRRRKSRLPVAIRIAIGVAAVLLVGIVGAGMSHLVAEGGLPFPGMTGARSDARVEAQNNLRQLALAGHSSESTRLPEERRYIYAPVEGQVTEITFQSGDVDKLAQSVRQDALSGLGDDIAGGKEKPSAANDLGYYPPARSLIVKGTSQFHTRTSGDGRSVSPDGYSLQKEEAGRELSKLKSHSVNGVQPVAPPGANNQVPLRGPQGTAAPDAKPADVLTITNGERAQLYTFKIDQSAAGGVSPGTGMSANIPPPRGFGLVQGGASAASKTSPPSGGDQGRSGATKEPLNLSYFIPAAPASGPQPSKTEPPAEAKQEGDNKPKDKGEGQNQGQGRGGEGHAGQPKKPEAADPQPQVVRKIIIRSGDIEFEIDSFDSAVATVTKLVNAIQGGFVATVNSEKLPNGKVRGSVVVRVPPESLDGLVLDLRKELGKAGELKGQRIGSQDITKQYTDLESRLRAARAMEERLLAIIKSGKGEIKDLLQAEKELGVWRTKIEEYEGELRYYGNLVALSTLTITLAEKSIQSPASLIETERVQMGLEVEDVDKSLREAQAAVAEAKGRVTKSEMKQHAAGQLQALLHFEVAPDAAGVLRDRLRQLGTVTRLEVDRLQQAEGGTGKPGEVRSKRNDTQFFVSLYNVANIAPREKVHLKLACTDTEAAYKAVLARVEKAAGRVGTSNLNRQRNEQTTGTIQFEVKTADADAVLLDLKNEGEVMLLQVTESADTQNVTRAKRGFHVELHALGTVAPRETTNLQLAVRDVPGSFRALQDAVVKAKGRVLTAQLNEQDKQNVTGQLNFEVRRTEESAVSAALAKVGDVLTRSVTQAQDAENTVDSKVLLQVTLRNVATIPPRETYVLGIEVANVEQAGLAMAALATESGGTKVGPYFSREASGRVTGWLVCHVPAKTAAGLVEKFKATGVVRAEKSTPHPEVPDIAMAVVRIEVTLSNQPLLVPSDEGLWPRIRAGLSYSLQAGLVSVTWLIVGALVVLPWVLLVYGGYRVVRRLRGASAVAT